MSARRPVVDTPVEEIVGRLLRIGAIAAAVIVAMGALALLLVDGRRIVDFRTFVGAPRALRTVGGVLREVAAGSSLAMIQLGLLVLVATPIARVAATLVAFAIERDRLYVVITTIVLTLLLFGLFS